MALVDDPTSVEEVIVATGKRELVVGAPVVIGARLSSPQVAEAQAAFVQGRAVPPPEEP